MSYTTKNFCNRIGIVFDFDETLIPDDSFKVLLKDCQINPETFEHQYIEPLLQQGWQKYLARTYCLILESAKRQGKDKITYQRLANLGRKLELVEGVSGMFNSLKQKAKEIMEEIDIEFYLISGGFVDIARHTAIASEFKQMWGCELAYDEKGEIQFIKQQMTHARKTHYLYSLSKGIPPENEKDLIYTYRDIPVEKLHIPLNQVIYVGDGTSDIPCFTVMNQYGGIPIGIFHRHLTAEEWQHHEKIRESQKLSNLTPASYQTDSELMRSLILAVECISKKIALRRLSIGK